jgi:hypothetical protein
VSRSAIKGALKDVSVARVNLALKKGVESKKLIKVGDSYKVAPVAAKPKVCCPSLPHSGSTPHHDTTRLFPVLFTLSSTTRAAYVRCFHSCRERQPLPFCDNAHFVVAKLIRSLARSQVKKAPKKKATKKATKKKTKKAKVRRTLFTAPCSRSHLLFPCVARRSLSLSHVFVLFRCGFIFLLTLCSLALLIQPGTCRSRRQEAQGQEDQGQEDQGQEGQGHQEVICLMSRNPCLVTLSPRRAVTFFTADAHTPTPYRVIPHGLIHGAVVH